MNYQDEKSIDSSDLDRCDEEKVCHHPDYPKWAAEHPDTEEYHLTEEDSCTPEMSCKPTKECIKTYKCFYKLYKICHYELFKVCPRCGYEFDYYRHQGLCPRCR